jgi:hypothetical protein
VAVRTVIDDAYAGGYFSSANISPTAYTYTQTGSFTAAPNITLWYLNNLSYGINSTQSGLANQVAALIGEENPSSTSNGGYWIFAIIGPKGSEAFNADGFEFYYFPNNKMEQGKPMVVVTQGEERLNIPDGDTRTAFEAALTQDGKYNSDAGYEVYHLIY